MAWEVEAVLRKMKKSKEAGKDQVNIETMKAGDETISTGARNLKNEIVQHILQKRFDLSRW